MAKAKYVGQLRDDLLYLSLSDFCKKYPHIKYNTAKGKRAYWRAKAKLNIEQGKLETMENLRQNQEEELNPNAELAIDLLSRQSDELESLKEIYETGNDRVKSLEFSFDKPSVKTLHLSELLLGHKDSAYDFFTKIVDDLPKLNPDLILISGIVQGDFPNLEKRRRNTLKPGLDTMNAQFKYGKLMLEALSEYGAPVVYNLSNDDRRIAEEHTVKVFSRMLQLANEKSPNYYQIDKMKAHPKWQEHLNFNIDYVFAYCLRAGRTLKPAEQMLAETGVELDEYMMLFDTVKRMERGEEYLPYEQYLELEYLGDTVFKITDDANLNIKTEGKEYNDAVRHYFGFSSQPMYKNHMDKPVDMIGGMQANGQETPDMLLLQHNMEEVGVCKGNTWIVSSGALFRPDQFFNSKGAKTDAPGDISRRLSTTRGRVHSPSTSLHERFSDGRYVVTMYTENFMNKANSCERTALPLLTDWQIGSLTARPDLLIKYLDYIQQIPENKNLYLNGDFVQGRNYPNFPNENQELGLISMDAQIQFVRKILKYFLKPDGVTKAFVTPGNHEWNSGTEKWHGYSFTQYIMDALSEKGIPNERAEGMLSSKGEKFKAWASVDYVGDYGIYVSHLPLMRGGKGSSGMPIYQAASHSSGVGEEKRSIDFEMYGHWHHPQYALFGDKLAVISGSLAGMSGYEWMRGYHPVISSVILHVGGGQPPQLEFLSQEFMENWEIENWKDSDIKRFLEDARKEASRGNYTELR